MMKLRHKITGQEFEYTHGEIPGCIKYIEVEDCNGELRTFQRDVLEPVPVQEEWERVTYADSLVIDNGILTMFLDGKWIKYPHPDLRFHEINGVAVLQRRTT